MSGSLNNRLEIEDAGKASCYYCISKFVSKRVVKWTDNNQTAICPICGIDAVLAGEIPDEGLLKMQKEWF